MILSVHETWSIASRVIPRQFLSSVEENKEKSRSLKHEEESKRQKKKKTLKYTAARDYLIRLACSPIEIETEKENCTEKTGEKSQNTENNFFKSRIRIRPRSCHLVHPFHAGLVVISLFYLSHRVVLARLHPPLFGAGSSVPSSLFAPNRAIILNSLYGRSRQDPGFC